MTTHTISRAYNVSVDFWRVRNFLIDTYPLVGPDLNWEIRRWDGCHTHTAKVFHPYGEELYRLWETEGGRIAGIVHTENGSCTEMQLHPDYRSEAEPEMVAWAEEHLSTRDGQGRRVIRYWVMEYDMPRQRLLKSRGCEKTGEYGVNRRLHLGHQPIPPPDLAEGYTLRATRPDDPQEAVKMAAVLNAGFGRTFHQPADSQAFFTCSPSFRHDLNLVAEAPDGSFAAHVGVTYEPVNRYAVFEPVCTHPDHRRKGLARSLMFEGLHRLRALGAHWVHVGTGDSLAANELYDAVGFTEAHKGYVWQKMLTESEPKDS